MKLLIAVLQNLVNNKETEQVEDGSQVDMVDIAEGFVLIFDFLFQASSKDVLGHCKIWPKILSLDRLSELWMYCPQFVIYSVWTIPTCSGLQPDFYAKCRWTNQAWKLSTRKSRTISLQ